eukprot:CAMPEP_0206277740 /NCGR_PEP_ID=MMETSP0047_2-20121206/37030_1 /ASSEMBLY_ACC=CAM_ASM_000192 /TAXON_ID=195065 /ORGANISM="Chroomonas mesostigmatica_cf, Strain CCMP1168" /LENGTH=92 /DNA_ID=CAMNT_0053707403 /DNA_START=105 /DNA_END=380 /DNA_ORIENTATION=-
MSRRPVPAPRAAQPAPLDLSPAGVLFTLEDGLAAAGERFDEWDQVLKAEASPIETDFIIRETEAGAVWREPVRWCARTTFPSERAAWAAFDK